MIPPLVVYILVDLTSDAWSAISRPFRLGYVSSSNLTRARCDQEVGRPAHDLFWVQSTSGLSPSPVRRLRHLISHLSPFSSHLSRRCACGPSTETRLSDSGCGARCDVTVSWTSFVSEAQLKANQHVEPCHKIVHRGRSVQSVPFVSYAGGRSQELALSNTCQVRIRIIRITSLQDSALAYPKRTSIMVSKPQRLHTTAPHLRS